MMMTTTMMIDGENDEKIDLPQKEMTADTPQATRQSPTDPVPSNTPLGEMKIPDPENEFKSA